ncbi:MAG: hypothetical protein M1115_09490 [Actinobacteria bacterium]|nr:hypothetical protein [Actinomycetota bacterium]
MIEVAAIVSAVVRHWDDLVVILVLLMFNSTVGCLQEHEAADAVEALRGELALRALARRDEEWHDVDATSLVAGDVLAGLSQASAVPDGKLTQGDRRERPL